MSANSVAGIGKTIRKLRTEHKLTQEELAEQLNVTSQAISKWESGAGLPDISQVVPLANVFGVSLDALFSKTEDDSMTIRRIVNEISEMGFDTSLKPLEMEERRWELYQKALGDYPTNDILLSNAMMTGGHLVSIYAHQFPDEPEKAEKINKERIRMANVLIRYSNDAESVMRARRELIKIYGEKGQFDLATEQLVHFPRTTGWTSGKMRELIYGMKGDKNAEKLICTGNISDHLSEALFTEAWHLGEIYKEEGNYEDAYFTFRAISDVLDVIYGDAELKQCFGDMRWIHSCIAECCVELGRYDEALDWLELMFDRFDHDAKYTGIYMPADSPLLLGTEYLAVFTFDSGKSILNVAFNRSCFDPIRDTERYQALQKRFDELKEEIQN